MLALVEKYPVTDRQALRPTGGFQFGSFSGTRAFAPAEAEAAHTDLLRAIELDEDNVEAFSSLALYYLKVKGDLAKAADAFASGLAIDSTDADLLNNLGILAERQDQYDRAAEWFRRALQYAPQHEEAHYNLAQVLQAQGKTAEAIAAWNDFLALANIDSSWQTIAQDNLNKLEKE